MRNCHSECLHRKLVLEYRDARDVWEARLEEETVGYETEEKEFRENNPPPTFKEWLIEKGGERQRYE